MTHEPRFDQPYDMTGRVALVTGGGTGIGRAAARAFARRGAAVALVGRRPEPLDEVATEIANTDGVALVLPADVSEPAQVDEITRRVVGHFGRIDFAFNNAGVEGRFGPLAELSAKDFDDTLSINLRGVWLCIRAQAAAMQDHLPGGQRRAGGAIVNCSSWLAVGALPGTTIYSASKAGLDGMTRAAALELAEAGIRVNNVNPGVIDTPMLRRIITPGTSDAAPFERHAAARRLGTSEEVAEAVVWLCSDAASFVTGQTLIVDGGYAIPGHRSW